MSIEDFSKEKGEGFFTSEDTEPYDSDGSLIGQYNPDSCLSACCRMLLKDDNVEVPESHLNIALEVDEGAYLSKVPEVLGTFGLSSSYIFRSELTLENLKESLAKLPVVVSVKRDADVDAHALILDNIDEDYVYVRDPLPLGIGSSYKVKLTDFLAFWMRRNTERGIGLVVE